ncbi:helix-turn-helix transcriptional regulator [Frankia sp. CNm7]|nr:helix-turn-helix transcriptional regulator [Frankia nepalensis]MBL7515465.1 helix-turn-helix transcriptional regulator [Frankia nepalensis]MBL7522604.1 helix-turn-helix transcriptional regulator [Frankia nepalensis]
MCLYVCVDGVTGLEPAAELLRALAAPVRLAAIRELAEGPRYVHELVASLGVSQPLLSQHLRVLRGAGLVVTRRHGREIAYLLADQHVAHIVLDAIAHSREGPHEHPDAARPAP